MLQSGLLISAPIYNSFHVINKELLGIIFGFIELSTVSKKGQCVFVLLSEECWWSRARQILRIQELLSESELISYIINDVNLVIKQTKKRDLLCK